MQKETKSDRKENAQYHYKIGQVRFIITKVQYEFDDFDNVIAEVSPENIWFEVERHYIDEDGTKATGFFSQKFSSKKDAYDFIIDYSSGKIKFQPCS